MKTIDVRPGEIVLGSKAGWPAWEWIPLQRTHDDRWLTWDWAEAEWDEWAYEPDFVAPLPAAEPEPEQDPVARVVSMMQGGELDPDAKALLYENLRDLYVDVDPIPVKPTEDPSK